MAIEWFTLKEYVHGNNIMLFQEYMYSWLFAVWTQFGHELLWLLRKHE